MARLYRCRLNVWRWVRCFNIVVFVIAVSITSTFLVGFFLVPSSPFVTYADILHRRSRTMHRKLTRSHTQIRRRHNNHCRASVFRTIETACARELNHASRSPGTWQNLQSIEPRWNYHGSNVRRLSLPAPLLVNLLCLLRVAALFLLIDTSVYTYVRVIVANNERERKV